jgi:hypothetical protein
MGFTVDETTTVEYAARLARLNGTEIEWVEGDNRHGFDDRGWRTFRFTVRLRPVRGGPWRQRMRRFYLHPSGFVVEGGKGGARIFEPPPTPLGARAVPDWQIFAFPFARVPNCEVAAMIVEALTA